jgi:hypothetical protein
MYLEEVLMNNKIDAVLSKATALLLAFTVTLTSCPVVSTGGDSDSASSPPRPPPVTPVAPPVEQDPTLFAFFYLDGKEPSVIDTGRTGFMTVNVKGAEELLIVSDDKESADPIVYFYGIEGISSVELRFARGEDFPERFVIHPEDGPDTTAEFSAYDENTATFSVTISDDVNTVTYDDLVLNSGVFSAYTYDDSLTPSQNLRIKNIVTSLALWTSLAYQTQSAGLAVERNEAGAYMVLAGGSKQVFTTIAIVFAVVVVVAVAVAVIAAPVMALASVVPNYAISVAGAVAASVAETAVGVALVSGIAAAGFITAAGLIEDPPPVSTRPPALPYSPGDPGPEGGVLFAVEYEDGYRWFEAAPDDLGPAKMLNGEAEAACTAYSTSTDGKKDWFLPDFTQLNYIYSLYNAGKLDCRPEVYWSSTPYQVPDISTQYYSTINFYEGTKENNTAYSYFFVRPVRLVSTAELASLYPSNKNNNKPIQPGCRLPVIY